MEITKNKNAQFLRQQQNDTEIKKKVSETEVECGDLKS